MCRRVADYPLGLAPLDAVLLQCVGCGAAIASDPGGPHKDKPHVCMQCCGVRPMPFPNKES
jgi:hypothetical protein